MQTAQYGAAALCFMAWIAGVWYRYLVNEFWSPGSIDPQSDHPKAKDVPSWLYQLCGVCGNLPIMFLFFGSMLLLIN
jgi:hypothetical protein